MISQHAFLCLCVVNFALLQDLDSYLQDKVYMAGNKFTIADVFIYHGVHPLIVSDHQWGAVDLLVDLLSDVDTTTT